MSAALALRAAVRDRLLADAGVTAALGGARVFDHVPAGTPEPYVVLAAMESRDAGTATEPGEEHRFALDIWSRQGGLAETLEVVARITAALDDAELALQGHRLANLRWFATDARRSNDGRRRSASVRFRAVTEPIG